LMTITFLSGSCAITVPAKISAQANSRKFFITLFCGEKNLICMSVLMTRGLWIALHEGYENFRIDSVRGGLGDRLTRFIASFQTGEIWQTAVWKLP
jgi:hypothetical protein